MKNNHSDFSNSVAQSLIEKAPNSTKVILYAIVSFIAFFFIWAFFANVEELVRSEAKVIPYGQNKIVQNFEGGIVKSILVEEGDLVKKGDVLIKIDNKQYSSTYEKNVFEIDELNERSKRLYAEANGLEYKPEVLNEITTKENDLHLSNIEQTNSKVKVLVEQLNQKKKEKNEVISKIKYLENSYSLIGQEIAVMQPLVEKAIVSKVEFLKLQREANSIKDELESTKLTLQRTNSMIKEFETRVTDAEIEFKNLAQREYNEVVSKINQVSKQNEGLEDQVNRTIVKSPITGYIKKIFINTIGGTVQPGMDLVEIVPNEEKLLIEARVKPEDIAFLRPGLNASVKFTAYDFSIYGSLNGVVEKISPDSITEEDKTFYLIYLKTDKSYLGTKEKPLSIMPGMRASADIITGQKSILTYLLKPIIKTKQYALTEK